MGKEIEALIGLVLEAEFSRRTFLVDAIGKNYHEITDQDIALLRERPLIFYRNLEKRVNDLKSQLKKYGKENSR